MKRLDRFLIKSFIGPFILTSVIVIFVLSMQFLWLYIDELVGKGLGLGVIMEFMGWAACTLIPMSLPLATMLASIMTMGGLGERNELLAMKAAGISLQRILRPLIIAAVIISVGAFFAANNLVPVAYNKIFTLRSDILNTKEEIKIPDGIFYDGIDGYSLRVERTDKNTGMMHKLMIYDHTSHSGNTRMTLADSGRMTVTPDKQNLLFDLYNGSSFHETNQMRYRDTSLELGRVQFVEQSVIISLKNYNFSRSEDDRFGDEVMSKGLKQLAADHDTLTHELDSIGRAQMRRHFKSGQLSYLYQLDPEWAENARGPARLDSVYAAVNPEMRPDYLEMAAGSADLYVDQISRWEGEGEFYSHQLRRTDIEGFRKFTLSLACLLFFFIGAPLGAIIRKGGFGTPVIISIFFYLIYYIIDMIGKRLATESAITPFAGTFVSSLVLLPIGVLLTRKSTRDSSLFTLDLKGFFGNIGKWFKKVYYKVRNLFRRGHGHVRIVYMGTPEFAVAPLDALVQGGYDIAAVVTVPDKPSGRGLKVNESAVKRYAIEHGLKVLQPEKLRDPEFIAELRALKANLFVVVAFRMLPREVWSMPYLGTFNLHASLLPQYRGAAPINWAVINGEKMTGVTTFLIDEQIDTGRILLQETCPVEEYDTAGSLHDKLMPLGAALVIKTVEAIRDRRVKPSEQYVQMHRALRPAPKLTKDLGHIDWTRGAFEIARLIRGLSPVPTAWSTLVNDKGETIPVKLYDAYRIRREQNGGAPGTITVTNREHLDVQCGEDALRIYEIQVSGKRRMSAKDFLLGFRDCESYHFE